MTRSLRAIAAAATVLVATSGLGPGAPATAADGDATLSLAAGRYVGGPAGETPVDIARGADGSVYVLTSLQGAPYPLDVAGFKGGRDALVLRMTPDLQTVTWAKTLGGSSDELPSTIEVDGDTVLVAGSTSSTNYPVTAGSLKTTTNGVFDGFVTRLSAATGTIAWSTYIGGTASDDLTGMAVGPDGRVWLTGSTYGLGFPTTPDGTGTLTGSTDGFLTALAGTGKTVSYSTFIGSPQSDQLWDVTTGPGGRIYVLGQLGSWSPPSPWTSLGASKPSDVAVLRFAMSGTKPVLEHTSYVGAAGAEYGPRFTVDSTGAVVVTGSVADGTLPLASPIQDSVPMPNMATFLAKISPSGTALAWSTYFGVTSEIPSAGVVVDARDDVYVAGATRGSLPLSHPLQAQTAGGAADGYVAKITADGRLAWSTYLGGSGADWAGGLVLDTTGAPVVAVGTDSTDAPVPAGSADAASGGAIDPVVLRIETAATVTGLSGPSGATATRTPTWTFGTGLAGAQTECRMDGAPWSPCTATYTAAPLADGQHSFQVRALDRPGHAGPVASATVAVDTAASTAITKHPRKRTPKAKARFAFTAEPGATFACKLDKRAWKTCKRTLTVKVKKGRHTLQVRATDALGNTDATPARFRWRRV